MIILHVSNLRFNRRWYRWILEKGPRHDLLVIAGNLVDHQHEVSLLSQREWVRDWLVNYDRPVCVASGPEDREFDPQENAWCSARWLQDIDSVSLCVDDGFFSHEGFAFHCIGYGDLPADRHADVWVTYCGSRFATPMERRNTPNGACSIVAASPHVSLAPMILSGNAVILPGWSCMEAGTLHLNPGWMPHAAFPNHVLLDPATRASCRVSETGYIPKIDLSGPVFRRSVGEESNLLMPR